MKSMNWNQKLLIFVFPLTLVQVEASNKPTGFSASPALHIIFYLCHLVFQQLLKSSKNKTTLRGVTAFCKGSLKRNQHSSIPLEITPRLKCDRTSDSIKNTLFFLFFPGCLTSPPLTYSITKHSRSLVWNEYFRDCNTTCPHSLISLCFISFEEERFCGLFFSLVHSGTQRTLCFTQILTVRNGCRVFFNTLLSVSVWATSSCGEGKDKRQSDSSGDRRSSPAPIFTSLRKEKKKLRVQWGM